MFRFNPALKSVYHVTAWLRFIALLLAVVAFPQVGLVPLNEVAGGELDELPLEVHALVRTERLAPLEAPHGRREPLPTPPAFTPAPASLCVDLATGHVLPNGQRAPLTC